MKSDDEPIRIFFKPGALLNDDEDDEDEDDEDDGDYESGCRRKNHKKNIIAAGLGATGGLTTLKILGKGGLVIAGHGFSIGAGPMMIAGATIVLAIKSITESRTEKSALGEFLDSRNNKISALWYDLTH